MRLKNLFITIGSIGGVVSTIPFVVSCNGSNHEGASTTDNNNDDDWSPKKYWYSVGFYFEQLTQTKGEIKDTYSMNVAFKSDNIYSQQEILDSIYSGTSPSQKNYFKYALNKAVVIDGTYLYSDIPEVNKATIDHGIVTSNSMSFSDSYTVSIANWTFKKLPYNN